MLRNVSEGGIFVKKLKVPLIFLFVLSLGVMAFSSSSSILGENERDVVKSNNQFAIDLYNKLSGGNGNVFFSPFSIFDALSMTYAGARGETEAQMKKVLHITLSQKEFHPAFSNIIKEIKSEAAQGKYDLNIANALWGQKGFHFLDAFLSLVGKYYDGNFYEEDFSNGIRAANDIDNWVDKQTNGKIEKIVGKISPLTRLILTNAIYFKGKWVSSFSASMTKSTTFYTSPGETVKAKMMYQESDFNYMENDILQAIEMPYNGEKLSMIVLLPKDKYGINEVEKTLNSSNLEKWISEMKNQKVKVYFPKFELKTNYELEDTLSSMGMKDAFSDADFSGMDGRKDLAISQVIHKAYIEVNEKGTEAAAVTAVVVTLTCSPYSKPEVPPVFRADHPFIFLIIDKQTGSILFMGKITTPK